MLYEEFTQATVKRIEKARKTDNYRYMMPSYENLLVRLYDNVCDKDSLQFDYKEDCLLNALSINHNDLISYTGTWDLNLVTIKSIKALEKLIRLHL
jgi:hypothetical protein